MKNEKNCFPINYLYTHHTHTNTKYDKIINIIVVSIGTEMFYIALIKYVCYKAVYQSPIFYIIYVCTH